MTKQFLNAVGRLPRGQQHAYVAISELLDKDPHHRQIALEAFEKTIIGRKRDIGEIIFKTLPEKIREQVHQVCAPYHVTFA